MLFNPNWEQETKADPFTLESLIAWLEKQPACQRYCYLNTGECLIARYLIGSGHCGVVVGGDNVDFDGCFNVPMPVAINNIAVSFPHTFGAALERARALQARSGE